MPAYDFFTRLVRLNELSPNNIQHSNEPLTVFVCGACGEPYRENFEAARECCRPQVLEYFQCLVCLKLHLRIEDAEVCCASKKGMPPVRCPVCLRDAESYADAVECCLHTHRKLGRLDRAHIVEMVGTGTPWSEAIAAALRDMGTSSC